MAPEETPLGADSPRTPLTQPASDDNQTEKTEIEPASESAKSPRSGAITVEEIAQAQRDAVSREAEAKLLQAQNELRLQDIKKRAAEYAEFDERLDLGKVDGDFWSDWVQNVVGLVKARGYSCQYLDRMDLNVRQASGALGLALHIFEAAVAQRADDVAKLMSGSLAGDLVTAEFKSELRQILKGYVGRNATRNSRLGTCLLGPYLIMGSTMNWTRSLQHLPLIVHPNGTQTSPPPVDNETGDVGGKIPQSLTYLPEIVLRFEVQAAAPPIGGSSGGSGGGSPQIPTHPEDGSPAASSTEWIRKLKDDSIEWKPCEKLAYFAAKYAEYKLNRGNKKISARDAYDYVKSKGIKIIDDDSKEAEELKKYKLPEFETFKSQLSRGRRAANDMQYEDRTGQHMGKSVVPANQIDPPRKEQDE